MRFLYAFAMLFLLACVVNAQQTSTSHLEWKKSSGAGDQWGLMQKPFCLKGVCYPALQLGTYVPSSGLYYELRPDGTFSEPKAPPIPPPAKSTGSIGQVRAEEEMKLFGVDTEKRSKRDKITYQGMEITQAEALELATGPASPATPDDAKKPHLTIVTKDAATKDKVEKDLGTPEAAPLVDHYRVQVYDASRAVDKEILKPFALEKEKRIADDGAVCMIQEPQSEGPAKVLCAVGGWSGPANLLAAARTADPTWDPSKAPGPFGGQMWANAMDWMKGGGALWLLGGAAVLLLLQNTAIGEKAKEAGSVVFRPWITPAATQTTVKRVRKTKTV